MASRRTVAFQQSCPCVEYRAEVHGCRLEVFNRTPFVCDSRSPKRSQSSIAPGARPSECGTENMLKQINMLRQSRLRTGGYHRTVKKGGQSWRSGLSYHPYGASEHYSPPQY